MIRDRASWVQERSVRPLVVPGPDRLPNQLIVGLDLGGTKLAGALVDPRTGALSHRMQEPTALELGGAAVLAQVEAMTARLVALAPVRVTAIGIGVPELVSPEGEVFSHYRIDWRGQDPLRRLSTLRPSRIESDVRAAALAEARLGAGRRHADFLYVSIGTGIACVSVRNGRPYPGARGAALVMANGRSRQVAGSGEVTEYMLEDEASGPGLVAAFRRAGGRADRAEDVLTAFATDPRGRKVIDLAALRLGQALALLAGALDPSAIVLGGGLGSAPGPYAEAIAREVRAGLWPELWPDDSRPLPILPAALGPDAGLIGAALGAQNHFTEEEPEHRPIPATLSNWENTT